MRAFVGVLAALLMLGGASLAQMAPARQATPASSAKAVAPSADAGGAAAGAVTAVPAVSFAAVPFAAGAKVFLEPMGGFEQFVAEAIVKKKVPVVLVKERGAADFVLSGSARVKKRGFFTGFVLDTHGGGSVSVADARTGRQVFGYAFHRVDQGVADYYIYQGWAEGCAKHLKKALEKKKVAGYPSPGHFVQSLQEIRVRGGLRVACLGKVSGIRTLNAKSWIQVS